MYHVCVRDTAFDCSTDWHPARFCADVYKETGKQLLCARFWGDAEGVLLPEVELIDSSVHGDSEAGARKAAELLIQGGHYAEY
jgi:hypothetical protein